MKSKIASTLIIIATFIVAIIKIVSASETIILHWDFWGNITSYGTKYYIIILPIISTILYLVLLHYEKNPYKMNRTSKIKETPSNFVALVRYVRATTPLVLLILLYVTLCSSQVINLQPLIIFAILIFIIAFYIYTYRKIRR